MQRHAAGAQFGSPTSRGAAHLNSASFVAQVLGGQDAGQRSYSSFMGQTTSVKKLTLLNYRYIVLLFRVPSIIPNIRRGFEAELPKSLLLEKDVGI